MRRDAALQWIAHDERRRTTLHQLTQPLTVSQLARRTAMPRETCSVLLRALSLRGLTHCLNHSARRSRVYWLTRLGQECRERLHVDALAPLPDMDWTLYGWVCYSHRSAVLTALDRPLQPAAIKRRARLQNPAIKMSANNVRDVIKVFLARGIVHPVSCRGRAHPRYALTRTGSTLQTLLFQAATRRPRG